MTSILLAEAHHDLFIHSPIDEHLNCFQYLSISSKVVKRMKDEPQRRWENICKACIQKKTCTTEVKVLAAQSCPTLCNPMNCSPPASSARGILQARILEWVSISSSRGFAQPRVQTQVSCISCIGRQVLYHWYHLASPLFTIPRLYCGWNWIIWWAAVSTGYCCCHSLLLFLL